MTESTDRSERPRIMVMAWNRRFAAPLRQTFQTDLDLDDQFMDLLEQAEHRVASKNASRQG